MTSEDESVDAREAFERLAGRFRSDPAVTEGTGFGSTTGLRVRGKIFVMLMGGDLVAKLPRARVDQLVASGTGVPFESGHGRPMKEWVTVPATHGDQWEQLADEAFAFVGSLSRP